MGADFASHNESRCRVRDANITVEAARAVLASARWDTDHKREAIGFGVCVAILLACTFLLGGVLGFVIGRM